MLTLNDSQVEQLQGALQTIGQFVADERETRQSSMLPAEEGSDESNYVIAVIAADDALDDIWKLIRGAKCPSLDISDLAATARQRAKDEHEREGEIEIDADAVCSFGDDDGCYVAAWVWVNLADVMDCECGRKRDQCATFDGEKEHGDR